jgi:DNA polymerase-1
MKPDICDFKSVWACDFEFQPSGGELPRPLCMVAIELNTGKKLRLNQIDLATLKEAPFSTGSDSLFIAYYAPAEFSCFNALGWPLPENCVDLFVEFRNLTNGVNPAGGAGLLAALVYFGQDALGSEEKEMMRNLAIRGGPYSDEEMSALVDYCETDVVALQKLFPAMLPQISLPHAVNRGRYMKAVSIIEKNGVPIDLDALSDLRENWEKIKSLLVERIDKDFGVFDGQTFKRNLFEQYLINNKLTWPRTELGALALDEDTFHEMVRAYPQVAPIKELRHALSQLRLAGLAVGQDGRNRTSLSPFRARTGRNQPSNSEFIFGPSCWLRGLIKPPAGFAISYIDWSQQEFGIAAALSNDPKMKEAYSSGDPYLAFAKQAGAVPPEGTKRSHPAVRDQFKACVLAVQYGMGEESLAGRIGRPKAEARHLLKLHRQTYRVFWNWSDKMVDYAMLKNHILTVFGWRINVNDKPNERSLRNYPMQANGAEMLRTACCLLVEAGIEVCAPVHDAILVMAPINEISNVVAKAQQLMEMASAIILDGFCLRSDEKTVTFPDRYMDPRGAKMWETVFELISGIRKVDVV